jgi:putative ABC transport system ATP-binding protein
MALTDQERMNMKMAARIVDLHKDYILGGEVVHALRGVTLDIPEGDYVAIMGPSGSGKSTLLNLIGCLDRPTAGSFYLGDEDVAQLDDDELSEIRAARIGFVFQSYNLIPVLSALENVEFVLRLQGITRAERESRARAILKEVGLERESDRRPAELSGGQQQRVAVARALVTEPLMVLADEPTANLDSTTAEGLVDLMRALNDRRGATFIIATHDPMIMRISRRVVALKDGRLADSGTSLEGSLPWSPSREEQWLGT